jgi:hypothetical protein
MIRFWAILVTGALFFSLPAFAQDLVSPKLLPPSAELRAAAANASFGQNTGAQPAQPAPKKHWTKGGKIMTFIGAGLLAGGSGALAYGLSNENSYSCSSGGTCIAVDWKWTGVGWMAAGGALTAIGLTRHSEY